MAVSFFKPEVKIGVVDSLTGALQVLLKKQ